MAYQQPQQEMRYSQQQQFAPQQYAPSPRHSMQQYQQQPFQSPQPHHQPPPPMRLVDQTIYNATTNQALYTYTISTDPSSNVPDSLLSLQHVPTGALVGVTHRGDPRGAGTAFGHCNCSCFYNCSCCSPDAIEDIISVGAHGAKASINDIGTARSAWSWKPTWSGGAEEWVFGKEDGCLILRDAVSHGTEVLRVEDGKEIRFGQRGVALGEAMVGEIMLVLATIGVEREESKWFWLFELLSW